MAVKKRPGKAEMRRKEKVATVQVVRRENTEPSEVASYTQGVPRYATALMESGSGIENARRNGRAAMDLGCAATETGCGVYVEDFGEATGYGLRCGPSLPRASVFPEESVMTTGMETTRS